MLPKTAMTALITRKLQLYTPAFNVPAAAAATHKIETSLVQSDIKAKQIQTAQAQQDAALVAAQTKAAQDLATAQAANAAANAAAATQAANAAAAAQAAQVTAAATAAAPVAATYAQPAAVTTQADMTAAPAPVTVAPETTPAPAGFSSSIVPLVIGAVALVGVTMAMRKKR